MCDSLLFIFFIIMSGNLLEGNYEIDILFLKLRVRKCNFDEDFLKLCFFSDILLFFESIFEYDLCLSKYFDWEMCL